MGIGNFADSAELQTYVKHGTILHSSLDFGMKPAKFSYSVSNSFLVSISETKWQNVIAGSLPHFGQFEFLIIYVGIDSHRGNHGFIFLKRP